MADPLSADAIEASLRSAFGTPLRFVESIDSTNRAALEWAAAGAPEGACVATDHQTAGRGRWGRSWASDPGRLLQFSVVLRPGLPVDDAGVITTALGVAACRAIEEAAGIEATLKWPNDVLIERRKVAGILVESSVGDTGIDVAIGGIGVNVDWPREQMPEEIRDRATSISAETGRAPDRAGLLGALLFHIGEWCSAMSLTSERRDEVIAEAQRRSEIIGRPVTVRFVDGSSVEGTATGLLSSGALELRTDEGIQAVHVGEIEQLRARVR